MGGVEKHRFLGGIILVNQDLSIYVTVNSGHLL